MLVLRIQINMKKQTKTWFFLFNIKALHGALGFQMNVTTVFGRFFF